MLPEKTPKVKKKLLPQSTIFSSWITRFLGPQIKLSVGFSSGEIWHWMKRTGSLKVLTRLKKIILSFDITCGPQSHYPTFPFKLIIKINNIIFEKIEFNACEQTYSVEIPIKQSLMATVIYLESDQCFVTPIQGRHKDATNWSVRVSNIQWEFAENCTISGASINYKYSRLDQQKQSSNDIIDSFSPRNNTPPSQYFPIRLCPLCKKNKQSNKTIGDLTPTRNLGEACFELVRCDECDLIFQTPLPHKEMLNYIYTFTTQFDDHEIYSGSTAVETLSYFKNRLSSIIDAYHLKSNGIKLLEIGCGLSWMARAIKSTDNQSLTVGQDISGEASEICTWVDHYIVGELQDQFKTLSKHGPYNLISMTHVIEHLQDPIATLQLCRKLLDRDGIIFITAPHRPIGWKDHNSLSELWNKWPLNHVPAHLQYFNHKSIDVCAQLTGMNVSYFSDKPSDGQSFEAWLDLSDT